MCLATINNLFLVLQDAPKRIFFPRTRDLLVSQKTTQKHFFSTLNPLFPVFLQQQQWWHLYCFAIIGSTSIVIHSAKQRLLRNRPGSDAATSRDISVARKITKGIHSCKPASLNRPSTDLSNVAIRMADCQIFSDSFKCLRLNFI